MTSATEITEAALRLPEDARATLAELLFDSLEDEADADDLGRVLEERSKRIRDGHATLHEADEIFEVYEPMKAERRAAQSS